mgnify:CR=1 FL=1
MAPMMQAMVLEGVDAPFRRATVDRPKPAAGQVLVRVAASGVNPLDLKIRHGQAPHARHPLPAVLGLDLAGTVESVGAAVTAFKPGDAVYGLAGGVGGLQGSLAEFIAAIIGNSSACGEKAECNAFVLATRSWTELYPRTLPVPSWRSGTLNCGTRWTRSPSILRISRLVARIVIRGQLLTRVSTKCAARSIRCSQLSSTRSRRRPPMARDGSG